jgi:hypothetical protein
MDEIYFVARTDIKADSGQQRVFGAFDTIPDAERFAENLKTFVQGTIVVLKGVPVGES